MLYDVGYCLEAAALQEHGALGAARLSVGDWLGLDGSLERCRLRRKVADGNKSLLRGFGWQGLGVCMGLCRRVWDRGSGTATLELCAIGLGRVEGHGSKQVGYGQFQDD
jgi:hypothetical protein